MFNYPTVFLNGVEDMIFRFDDICINADMNNANALVDIIRSFYPKCDILYCMSPLVCDMDTGDAKTDQRIFPKIFNAYSDYRKFYKVTKCSVPNNIPKGILLASHGLVHVDHRLLEFSAQEMSILVSCSLTGSSIFVPPFNKWNYDTEKICNDNEIDLVKFEDGWLCAEYNPFNVDHEKWYLHSREFTPNQFKQWMIES
jgi:hypothetical protein